MKLNVAIKYQLNESKKGIIIYYLIIISFMSFFLISSIQNLSGLSSSQMGGMEMTTVIFLFILGLLTFKESFGMFLQNSLSRKTIFISKICTYLIFSIALALIDNFILLLEKSATMFNHRITTVGLFEQIYDSRLIHISDFQMHIESLLFAFFLYFATLASALFIAILYYKMNVVVKTIVSVGVPVSLFIVLPLIDSNYTHGKISIFISNSFDYAFGLSIGNPYYAMITCILSSALISCLSWLLIKRAVIND